MKKIGETSKKPIDKNIQNSGNGKSIGEVSRKKRLKLPLRIKISLPYLVLTLGLGAFAAFIALRILFSTVENRFNNQLLEAGKISHEWMVNLESSILENIRLIANIEDIDSSITQLDLNSLRDFLYPIALNAEIDSVIMLDPDGLQLIGMNHVDGMGIEVYDIDINPTDYSSFEVVEKIRQYSADGIGDKYAGFFDSPVQKIMYIGGPIINDEGLLLGIILAGEYADSIKTDMRASTLSQVTIYDNDGRVISSSFFPPFNLEKEIASTINIGESDLAPLRDFVAYEIEYGEVLSPLIVRGSKEIGILGNALPKNFLLNSPVDTQVQILVYIVFAVALSLIIGFVISKLVSRPIMQIINASKSISRGDYSVSVDTSTGDEIEYLANSFNQMVTSIKNSKDEILNAYDNSLIGWTQALALRDKETEGHCQRVAEYTVRLAKKIGYPEEEIDNLYRGALLHDIGKMGVPDNILLKPGKLDDQEWVIMKQHPGFAFEFLKNISFLESSVEIPFYHHEKWDGSGYPKCIMGEEIPLSARLFAIVDVWDALNSDRAYRKAMEKDEIYKIIREGKGSHFDPDLVDPFLNLLDEDDLNNNENP
jgi:HAMP domain-containing protein